MAEALGKLIRKGKPGKIVDFFAGMSEKERRALAPGAVALARAGSEFIQGTATFAFDGEARECANLAALATASLTELKKLGWRGTPPLWDPGKQDLWLAILRDRAPDWIDDWAEWLLQENHRAWRFVRRMERAGLCRPSESDAYVLGMIEGLAPAREGGSLIDGLLEAPDLLDGPFWRLFEVEGGGEVSLANFEKFGGSGGNGWAHAMRELSARGELDRSRLLDASLEALARDFSQYRAGWFSRFHEYMEPTIEERAARTRRYLDLLASPIPPTVAFAMKSLAALHKAKRLDGAAFVARAEPVLYAKAKGTVKQALRLLAAFAKADATLAPEVCQTAAAALEHTEPEVQEAALALIESFADPADLALRAAIEDRGEVIAASLQGRVSQWLGSGDASSAAALPDAGEQDIDALRTRASKLPPDLAEAAGVDLALQALDALPWEIDIAPYNGLNVPRLSEENQLTPIHDLDSLINLYIQALDDAFDVETVEQVLDGVCRLCSDRSDDFGARTKPLAKKLAAQLKTFEGFGSPAWSSPLGTLTMLGAAWLEGTQPNDLCGEELKQSFHIEQAGAAGIFLERAVALASLVASGKAFEPLSTPTHRGGWIAGSTLVDRLRTWQGAGRKVADTDLVLALLRLAPDRRAAALDAAQDLEGEAGSALRHALGAPGEKIGKNAPLWIAAARARAPLEDDGAVETKFPGLGPDAGRAAKMDFDIETRTWHSDYSDKEESWDYLQVLHSPAPAKMPPSQSEAYKHVLTGFARKWEKYRLMPTVLMHIDPIESTFGAADGLMSQQKLNSPWASLLWPINPKPLYAATALNAAGWVHSQRPNAEPPLAGYRVAMDPDAFLGRWGEVMLCMGLNALDSAEREIATDLLIAAVREGRLNTRLLPFWMRRLVTSTLIKPKRWAARLREAGRESPLHAQAIRQVLERLVDLGSANPPRDIHALMELLHELCVETGEAVTDPRTRDYLASIKGGGKAAKLAKTLLALEEGDPLPHRRAAAALALTGRIERAERWAARR